MKQAITIAILSMVLFAACSSNETPKTQYYLLNNPIVNNKVNVISEQKARIAITLLELPDYLKQPSLVLQLSDHQLHYSNFHMWAEPLQTSFAQALVQDTNSIDENFQYISSNTAKQQPQDLTLFVNITAFHTTHQSQAILVGNYWLEDKHLSKLIKAQNFNLTLALNENGYGHAVTQMRNVILKLAKQIANHEG